jgi:signal transduction histidine kinase/CRP-like cAMP-binding protein/ActR/RegA family two-component response regulator
MDPRFPPEKIISILKGARLFNQFDETQLVQLLAFSVIKRVKKGATIIAENEPNQDIYILLQGSVNIFVGDELILKLRRKGDIIGEMSVITQSLTTASVVAATPATLFKIPSQKIVESDQETLRSQWFKIFSDILSQKLSMTNRQVVGFHEASTELDEKKKQLIRKTLILQSILGSMDDGVVVTDGSGSVLHVNPAFLKMTGHRRLPDRIDKWPETIGFYQSDGNTLCDVSDLPMMSAHGTSRSAPEEFYIFNDNMETGIWLQATASLLKTEKGEQLEGCVVVFRNYTKKKHEESALIRAKENAEAAARAKSDFLSVMSHELRTPLNAILGMSDLLKSSPLSSEQTQYADNISRSGHALLEKIKTILFYNALESGDVQIKKEPLSLKKLIGQVIESHRPAARDKKISLQSKICKTAAETFSGDRDKIILILDNLIGNAVKYTDKGSVGVSAAIAEQNDTSVKFTIAVQDTGIGIPSPQLDRLFQPFSQADASLSRRFEGVGLGLAVTKKTVEFLGGEIKVKSRPEKGTTFSFTLILSRLNEKSCRPLKKGNATAPVTAGKDYAQNKPLDILVAEDNKVNQLLIKKVLANLGYTVDIAQNGLEAVDACRVKSYHLVLMDIQMPEMDGITAAKEILAAESSAPPVIVALTANTAEGIRETCLDAGMTNYIPKPLDIDMLVSVLEQTPGRKD